MKSIFRTNGDPEITPSTPSVFSLSELPADPHDLYLLTNRIAVKVSQYSAAAFNGEKLHLKGSQSQAQLQLMLNEGSLRHTAFQYKQSQTTQNLSQLEKSLAASQLPTPRSFSSRRQIASTPTQTTHKTATLAASLQIEDPSLPLCLAPVSQNLTPEEKKEVVKATIGQAANCIAAPFAALNLTVKTAFKVGYLASVHHYCAEVEPHNKQCISQLRHSLEGRNPEVNKAFKEAMPRWILNTGKALAALDHHLHLFDSYMVQHFYTYPGLMHAGAEGMIDVGLGTLMGAAAGMGVKAFKGVKAAAKPAIKATKDAYETRKFAKLISKPAAGETSSALIPVFTRMKAAAANIKQYTNPDAFLRDLPKSSHTTYQLRDTQNLLPEIARGRSSSQVYFVFENERPCSLVVKDFPGLISGHSQFANTLIAQNKLNAMRLSHFDYPALKKIGQYLPEGTAYKHGLLLMSQAKGKSLVQWLHEVKQLPLGNPLRAEYLAQFRQPIEKTGRGIAELHRKSLTDIPPPAAFIEQECQKMLDFFLGVEQKLQSHGLSLAFGKTEMETLIAQFKKNPGYAACSHGDVHFPNFIWDANSLKITAIDTGSLARSLNAQGRPIGIPATDLAQMKVSIEYYGRGINLSHEEISLLQKAFYQGYAKELNIAMHSPEALKFYDVYWNLLTLELNTFESINPAPYINNLNAYFHKALDTAQKIQSLKKPWAHEPLLEMSATRQLQDLKEIRQGIMKTYTAAELKTKELVLKNGYLYQGSSKDSLHSTQMINFVILENGSIRIDFKHQKDNIWSYHSSLVLPHEKPVAAGEISFWGGRVSVLTEVSGHYLPHKRIHYVEEELKSRGAAFTEDYVLLKAEELILKLN